MFLAAQSYHKKIFFFDFGLWVAMTQISIFLLFTSITQLILEITSKLCHSLIEHAKFCIEDVVEIEGSSQSSFYINMHILHTQHSCIGLRNCFSRCGMWKALHAAAAAVEEWHTGDLTIPTKIGSQPN